METQRVTIDLKGVQRNVSPVGAPAGTCKDIVNLRPKDGGWRPVLPKTEIHDVTASGIIELFAHSSLPENHYLRRYPYNGNERISHVVKMGASSFNELEVMVSYPTATVDFKSLVCINDVVIISTTEETTYHVYNYDDDRYKINESINDLPDIRIAAGNHDQNKFDEIANQETTWAEALANYLEFRRDQAENHKRYNGHIGLIAAYRMTDGTIIKHSAPILHLAGAADDNYSEIIKPFEHETNKRIIGLTVSKLKYYIKEEIPEGWGSVIDSIDVYACRIPLIEEIDVEVLMDNIGRYDPFVPFVDVDSEFTNKIFNKIDSIKLSGFETAGGDIYVAKEVDIDLAHLETKEALSPDQLTVHQIGFGKGKVYNGRVHAANVENILFPGHLFDLPHLAKQKTNNDYLIKRSLWEQDYEGDFTSLNYNVVNADSYLVFRVWIDTGGGEEEISIRMPADSKMFERNLTTPDRAILLNKIITYPHPRAKRFDITLYASGDPAVLIHEGEFIKHNMYPFVYHIFKRSPSDDYWPGHFKATHSRFEFVMKGDPPKQYVDTDSSENLAFVFTLYDNVEPAYNRIYIAVWQFDDTIPEQTKDFVRAHLVGQGYDFNNYPVEVWIPLYSAEDHLNGYENHIDIGDQIIADDSVLEANYENISTASKTIIRAKIGSAMYDFLNLYVPDYWDFVESCEVTLYQEDSSAAVPGTGYAYYPGYLDSAYLTDEVSAPSLDNIAKIADPNRLQLSEVENPFIWPVRHSYRIGEDQSNKIADLAIQAAPTSEGQFGEYPLIVFAANGIYLVNQGTGGVVYSNIIKISALKANEGVFGIDGAIMFTTVDGLFLLQGRQVRELNRYLISNIVYQTQETFTPENPLDNTSGGLAFLQDAIFAWDNQHKEIIITKPGESYHYRFNVDLGIFFIASGSYNGFILTEGSYQGYTINNNLKIYNIDADDTSGDEVRVYFKSNPQLLVSSDFKKIQRLMLYCDTQTEGHIDDWFLPSKDELNAIYDNLVAHNVGNFENKIYWSSSEWPDDTRCAWSQYFNENGTQSTVHKHSQSADGTYRRVRPCRSFTGTAGDYPLRSRGPGGGLVFAHDGGLVYEAASSDVNLGIGEIWSNRTSAVGAGAQGTAIGTGEGNTAATIAQTGHEKSAALLCDQYLGSGYLNLFVFGGNIINGTTDFIKLQENRVDAGNHPIHMITGRTPVSMRYFVFMLSGQVNKDSVFQHLEAEVTPVLAGRLR